MASNNLGSGAEDNIPHAAPLHKVYDSKSQPLLKNGECDLNQDSSDKQVRKDQKQNSKMTSQGINGFIEAKPDGKDDSLIQTNPNKASVLSQELSKSSTVCLKKVTNTVFEEKASTTDKEIQTPKVEGKRELPTKTIEVHRQKLRLIKMMSRQPEMK